MPEGDIAERLRAEGLDPGRWTNAPGDRYAVHRHDYDKVIAVERGSIVFRLDGGRAIELTAGDRLELPAGTGHDARVGPDGVSCLEAHRSPGALGIADARRLAADGW